MINVGAEAIPRICPKCGEKLKLEDKECPRYGNRNFAAGLGHDL